MELEKIIQPSKIIRMKKNVLLLFLLLPFVGFGQSEEKQRLADAIAQLRAQLNSLENQLNTDSVKYVYDAIINVEQATWYIETTVAQNRATEEQTLETEIETIIEEEVTIENEGEMEEDWSGEDNEYGFNKSWKDRALEIAMGGRNKKTKTYFTYALGINQLFTDISGVDAPETQVWNSRVWELGFTVKTRLGGEKSPIRLTYGLGFQRNNFTLPNSQLVYDALPSEGVSFVSTVGNNINRSKFSMTYFTVPLGLEFSLGKRAYVGFNGYGGILVRASTETESLGARNEEIKTYTRARFNVNNFMYGARAYVGYKAFSIYGKFDVSDLFDSTTLYNVYSFGVKFDF